MSIAVVVFNASNVAIPNPKASYNDVEEYVNSVQVMNSFIDCSLIASYCGKYMNDVLACIERMPSNESIKELFKSVGYSYVSANDLSQIAYRILGLMDIEEYYGIKKMVASSTKCKEIDNFCKDTELLKHIRRTLEVLLILGHRGNCTEQVFAFQREINARVVMIASRISILEHEIEDLKLVVSPEKKTTGRVRLANCLKGMIMDLDCASIMGNCKEPKEFDLILRAAIFQSREKLRKSPNWAECLGLTNYSIRDELHKIITKGRPDKSFYGKAIRAIVEAIENEEIRDFHELRINKSKGSPQKVRSKDGAKAYRRIIDDAVRLHYWKRKDGHKELAYITTEHDDFYIPDWP